MFTAAAFIIAKRWRWPEVLSEGEQINTMWSSHTMGGYTAVNRGEVLAHAQMDPENIILSETRHKRPHTM